MKDPGSALVKAVHGGNAKIVEILLDHGADPNDQSGTSGGALRAAAEMGNLEIAALLLSRGAEPNGRNVGTLGIATSKKDCEMLKLLLEWGTEVVLDPSALASAIGAGYKEAVQQFLDLGADVNSIDPEIGSALQAAAYDGDAYMVHLLIENGANVDSGAWIQDYHLNYSTPLQAASLAGHIEIVSILLEAGACVESTNDYISSALQCACSMGHEEIATMLLSNGANVNQSGNDGNELHAAVRAGAQSLVELLLSHGADPNLKDSRELTALQIAAEIGSLDITRLLLERGANPLIMTEGINWCSPAIHLAARNRHIAVVEAILEDPRQDINIPDTKGFTLLHVAAGSGDKEMADLLIRRNGVKLDVVDSKGNSPLHFLVDPIRPPRYHTSEKMIFTQQRLEIATDLIDRGASLSLRDNDGFSPLIRALVVPKDKYNRLVASEAEIMAMVQLLSDRGANLTEKTSDGRSVVHLAASAGLCSLVEWMVTSKSLEINLSDNNGSTALMLAAAMGHESVVRFLLSQPTIDIQAHDLDGRTSLSRAAENIEERLMLLLVEHGATPIPEEKYFSNSTLHALVHAQQNIDNFQSSERALRCLKILLKLGANLTITCSKPEQQSYDISRSVEVCDKTLLHCISRIARVDMLKIILDTGKLDVDAKDSLGRTAMHIAASSSRPFEQIKMLVENGGNYEAQANNGCSVLLQLVNFHGYERGDPLLQKEKAMIYLLEEGADPKVKDVRGFTTLHLAAWRGSLKMVQALLDWNADIHARTTASQRNQSENGYYYNEEYLDHITHEASSTPLHLAAARLDMDIARLLLSTGADVNAKDSLGRPPLAMIIDGRSWRTANDDDDKVSAFLQILIDFGADLKDGGGSVMVHLCEKETNISMIEFLLNQGIDPNSVDDWGQTGLHRAVSSWSESNRIRILELLLKHGADIDAVDDKGRTPLALASGSWIEWDPCRDFLLKNGANPALVIESSPASIARSDSVSIVKSEFGEDKAVLDINNDIGEKDDTSIVKKELEKAD
jgi:ankyrin repeat protein